ncbi:group-specific protein [Lysinibacillus piscis]|uniref:Group-specific protein n=1 Tax=Lysinibacillus piscis TaxID=2518931 RepID=A0ABQ5NJF1_9BACI|nr:group-specific protein [Lysinibacillus sp. KH24]GLC88427.1 hypothetical protein LYSBPC_15540 [Lysinibacillus sp. KH24]
MLDVNEFENDHFILRVDSPYSLNYLIFVQNVFLNNRDGSHHFPSVDSSKWNLLQHDDFQAKFKSIWDEVVRKNTQSPHYDYNGVLESDAPLYRQLFEGNVKGDYGFSESIRLFQSWWGSIFFGKGAVEMVYVAEGSEIYDELAIAIKSKNLMIPNNQLTIMLLYDKQTIVAQNITPYHYLLPMEELFLNKNNIVMNILNNLP